MIDLDEYGDGVLYDAEYGAIDDAAHIPHYEHPEIVNPLVVEFLNR